MEELHKEYWDNGETKKETPLYNDKKHGIEKTYYNSGKKYSEFNYVNGVPKGVARNWYLNGELCFFNTMFFMNIHGVGIKLNY